MAADVQPGPSGPPLRAGAIATVRAGLASIGPKRRLLHAFLVVSAVSAVLESGSLFLIARLATTLSANERTISLSIGPISSRGISVGTAVFIALGVLVAQLLVAYPAARFGARLSSRTLIRARSRIIARYLASPWEERAGDAEGYFHQLATEYGQRNETLVQQVATMISVGLSLAALIGAAVVVSPIGAGAAVLALGLLAMGLRPFVGGIREGSLGIVLSNRHLASRITQTARVSQEIAAFDVAEPVTADLDQEVRRGAATLERIRFLARFTPAMYQVIALVVIVGAAGLIVLANVKDSGSYAPVLLLLIRALAYGRQLQTASQAASEVAPYSELLEEALEGLAAVSRPRGHESIDQLSSVLFVDVAYEYVPGHPALEHVDLVILEGEAIGLIGPSGGGKSTLTHLLLGLRLPTRGSLFVNDIDLVDIDPARLAEVVAYVPQDNKLIHGTVAANIRFYRDAHSDEEVREAAIGAHLHDEIVSFPDGYDTLIGPGARDLSGGQKQRLGIARALLGRPQLLVLDEPTSALDERSEDLIRQTLVDLHGSTTLVIVAHRPATLQVCDRVFEVRHAKVTPVERPRRTGTRRAAPRSRS